MIAIRAHDRNLALSRVSDLHDFDLLCLLLPQLRNILECLGISGRREDIIELRL